MFKPKYRVVETEYSDGRKRFVPQTKFFWYWLNCVQYYSGGTHLVSFKSFEEAKNYLTDTHGPKVTYHDV